MGGRWRNVGYWWNNPDGGKTETTRPETFPSTTFSTTNPTLCGQGQNPGLRGVRQATNCFRHGPTIHVIDWVVRIQIFFIQELWDARITCYHESALHYTFHSAVRRAYRRPFLLVDVGTPVASWPSARTPRSSVPVSSVTLANFALMKYYVILNCLMSAAEKLLFSNFKCTKYVNKTTQFRKYPKSVIASGNISTEIGISINSNLHLKFIELVHWNSQICSDAGVLSKSVTDISTAVARQRSTPSYAKNNKFH